MCKSAMDNVQEIHIQCWKRSMLKIRSRYQCAQHKKLLTNNFAKKDPTVVRVVKTCPYIGQVSASSLPPLLLASLQLEPQVCPSLHRTTAHR